MMWCGKEGLGEEEDFYLLRIRVLERVEFIIICYIQAAGDQRREGEQGCSQEQWEMHF